MADTLPPPPMFNFVSHPSAQPFTVPGKAYKPKNAEDSWKYKLFATGAIVFESSTPERVLLIQRAAHDSMPGKWETPGGGCDDSDPSILHGVARELWEEAGLIASKIGPPIGDGYFFFTRSQRLVCKFNFLVEAQRSEDGSLNVKLDPEEHQNYVWATEEEVKAKKVGDIELRFTVEDQEKIILEAFKVRSLASSEIGH